MKKALIIIATVMLVLAVVSCGGNGEVAMYATIDSPNVRTEPDPDLSGFDTLDEGERVIFLSVESETTTTYHLRGKDYTSNFLLIRMEDGQEGWVFASALSTEKGFILPTIITCGEDEKPMYAVIDKPNVRLVPDPSTDGFDTLDEGEKVCFLGEESETTTTYHLRGKDYTSNFLLIRMEDGQEGWVFASALSRNNTPLRDYDSLEMKDGIPLYSYLTNKYKESEQIVISNEWKTDNIEGFYQHWLAFNNIFDNEIVFEYNGYSRLGQEDEINVKGLDLSFDEVFEILKEDGTLSEWDELEQKTKYNTTDMYGDHGNGYLEYHWKFLEKELPDEAFIHLKEVFSTNVIPTMWNHIISNERGEINEYQRFWTDADDYGLIWEYIIRKTEDGYYIYRRIERTM